MLIPQLINHSINSSNRKIYNLFFVNILSTFYIIIFKKHNFFKKTQTKFDFIYKYIYNILYIIERSATSLFLYHL